MTASKIKASVGNLSEMANKIIRELGPPKSTINIFVAHIVSIKVAVKLGIFGFSSSEALVWRKWGKLLGERMPEEDLVELKLRLYDGLEVGPFRYSPASTVVVLKERIVVEWPKGHHKIVSRNNRIHIKRLEVELKRGAAAAAGANLQRRRTTSSCRWYKLNHALAPILYKQCFRT